MELKGGEDAFDAQGPCEFGVEGHCVVVVALPGPGGCNLCLSVGGSLTAVSCRKEKRRRLEG